jgi:uncharacterized protein (DUF488 family)
VTVYTIGHSTHPIAEFGALLQECGVELVADVRLIPRSRANPQFNIEALPAELAAFGVSYQHIPELGGRRHRARGAPPSPNTFWRNESFRNYADYAATDAYKIAIGRLEDLARHHRCAVMCAEALWWRCHRRIISDYLLERGMQVLHIMGPSKLEPAKLTSNAQRLTDGTLVYPT